MNTKPLMKYRASYNNEDSWALAPLVKNTPVLAGFYDPKERVLALILDSKKEGFISTPKEIESESEVMRMDKYFEHYLSHPDDIKWFLSSFAENNFKYQHKEDINKSFILQP